MDFDNLTVQLDEESETASNLRGQLQRSQADYQQLKTKYDKEVLIIAEELEESR